VQSAGIKKTTINIGGTILFLLTGVGLILFWRGTWQISEKLFNDQASLILGLFILICVAILKKEQVFKIFGISH
jgi:hypothetical protein